MSKKKQKIRGRSPWEYSSGEGYGKALALNARLAKEQEEAARERNAELRRAAERKIAEEDGKRKKEMSEEEYKKYSDILKRLLEDEESDDKNFLYHAGNALLGEDLEDTKLDDLNRALSPLRSILGYSLKTIGSGIDAVVKAFDKKQLREDSNFIQSFDPAAISKAQEKYDNIKPQEAVFGTPKQEKLIDTTAYYSVPDKDLAKVQAENTDSQRQRTETYKQLTAPKLTYVDVPQEVKDSFDARNRYIADSLEALNRESRIQEEMFGERPKGYGVSEWWSDAKTLFLINMNEAQRDDFAGRIQASNEFKQRVDEGNQYKRNLNLLNWYEQESKRRPLTDQEKQEIDIMLYENKHLKASHEYVLSMIPNAMQRLGLDINDQIDKLISSHIPQDISSSFGNDVDALRLLLISYKYANTDEEISKFQRKFGLAVKAKQEEWLNGIKVNQADIDRHEANHKVSDYFKYKERTENGIFNPSAWFYKQPGLFGYSQSAWLKQDVAMALNLGLGAIPGAAVLKAAVGAGVTLPMAMSASESENFAEVNEHYKQALKNKLASVGMLKKFVDGDENAEDVDQAIENFVQGKYVPTDSRIMQAAYNATYGINSLFQDDMAATTMDDMIDTAIMLTPFGLATKHLKAGKKVAATGKVVADSFTTGASVGGVLGGVANVGIQTVFGKTIDKAVDNTVHFMKAVPYKVLGKGKYRKVAEAFGRKSIPHKLLTPEQYVYYQTFKDFGLEAQKRIIKSGLSEGVEESKQYYHGKAFEQGDYRDDNERKSIFSLSTMVDDLTSGVKTAYVMAGMLPFIPNTTNDAELIENIEGGIMGGLFLTGAQVHAAGLKDMALQQKINHFALKQALYNKLEARDAYEKYKLYAKKAGDTEAINRMNSAFNMYRSAVNARQPEDDLAVPTTSLIDAQQEKFNQIVALADTEFMKDAAIKAGIIPQSQLRKIGNKLSFNPKYSPEYREYVALIGMLQDGESEANDRFFNASQEVRSILSKQGTPYSLENGSVLQEKILQNTGEKIKEVVNPIESGDTSLEGEALLKHKELEYRSNAELFTNIAVLKQLADEINEALIHRSSIDGVSKDLLFVRDRIKQELQRNLDRIKKDKRKDVLDNVEGMLSGISDLDNLKKAVRAKQLAQAEVDYYDAVVNGALGEYGKPEDGSVEESRNLPYSKFNAIDLLKSIKTAEEDDWQIQENIEKDWLSNFSERSRQAFEDERRKLEQWRVKAQKKAEELAKADAAVTTQNTEESKDENGGEVTNPQPAYEVQELLPEAEKPAVGAPEPTKPTGTPADNNIAASKPKTVSQQKSLDALAAKHEADKQLMEIDDPLTGEKTVDRTGHDYFIKDSNGKVRMYGRTHSYLDRQYDKTQQEKDTHDKHAEELRKLWKDGKKKEFEKKALEYEKEFEDEFKDFPGFNKLNIQRYLDYLNDGNEAEIEDIIEAIADLTSSIPADASVIVGKVIDEACRTFFSTGQLPYSQVEQYMSEKVYEEFVRLLKNIQDHYTKLGWQLIAEPHYFYSELYDSRTGTIRRVAGETDMIAIDEAGNYHIIDFKTSKKPFHDQYGAGGQKEFNPFTEVTGAVALNDSRVQKRSAKDFYTDQQAMYTIMLLDNLSDAVVESREILPFVVGYNSEIKELNTSLGSSRSSRINTEKAITSVKNEIPKTDPITHNVIVDPSTNTAVMEVQRIPLDMSLTIADRFLDKNNKAVVNDKIADILDASPFDFYYDMPQEDRDLLSAATIDAILRLADEYSQILEDIEQNWGTKVDTLSIITKAENLIRRAEQLQILAEAEVAAKEAEKSRQPESKPLTDPVQTTDEDVANQQQDPQQRLLKQARQLFDAQIERLEILKNDVLYHKYDNSEGLIGGEAITAANQLLSNLSQLLNDYPELFSQEDQDNYSRLFLFFQQGVNIELVAVKPQTVNQETLGSNLAEWMSKTTTWKALNEDSVGIEDAVAEDGSKLLDVTGDPDFINLATFELTMKPTRGSRKASVNRIHVIVHYKGKTYTPVAIHGAETMSGRAFYNAVRLAVGQGKKIIIKNSAVSRTNGRIKNVKQESIGKQGIVNDNNYYEITYNSNQTLFCIAKVSSDPITNEPVISIQVPGENPSQRRTVSTWKPENPEEIHSGTIIMMTEPVQNEPNAEHNRIPLVLNESKLTMDDALLVLDILTVKTVGSNNGNMPPIQALGEEFVEEENGLMVPKGLTNRQVLNLLIPYGPSRTPGKDRLFLSFSEISDQPANSQSIIYVHGRVKGDPIDQQPRAFDLTTEQGKLAFLEFLTQNVTINIDEDVMKSRIQLSSNTSGSPFGGLNKIIRSEYGQKVLRSGGSIKFGKSRIQFDAKDIQNPNDSSDRLGASGIAWYGRRGFLESRFGGFENTLLCFDDKVMPEEMVESPKMPEAPSTEQAIQAQNETILGGDAISSQDITDQTELLFDQPDSSVGFDGEEWRNKAVIESKQDFDEQTAREHLRKILGKNVSVDVIDGFIDTLASGAHVVGRVYADTILLSRAGEAGVEWHEAFHRILEILASNKTRERIYMAYCKAVDNYTLSDHQIGEALADQFMQYMMNRPAINLGSIKNIFKTIKEWKDFYKSIGSFQLFWYYTQVSFGRYKNVKPNPERLAKFKKLYPSGANFTVGSTGFKHILNEHMYKELKKTLILLLLQNQNIDPAGRNIQDLLISDKIIRNSRIFKNIMMSDQELIKAGIGLSKDEKTGKTVFKRVAAEAPYDTKLALQELLDNWNSISDDIASSISQFSTDYTAIYEQENTANANAGEAAGASIAEHIHASYEFSQFSRTSSKVRFFFSRIPKCRYQDGKIVQELNELGLPTYYDAKYIFNYVLNQCHNINSKSELIQELEELGKSDPMFSILAQRIQNLLDRAKTNVNDAQLMTLIFNSIKTAKNTFVIGKSVQQGDYFSVVILSTDTDYTAQKYKKEWSKLFASGASLYVEVGPDGKLLMKNGYSADVFVNLAKRFQLIVDCFSDAENPVITIDGKNVAFDKTSSRHVEIAKRQFIKAIQSLGIQFDYDQLNFILSRKPYGDVGFTGMQRLLHQEGVNDIRPFIRMLTLLSYKGKLNIDENGKFTYVDPNGKSSTKRADSIFVGAGAGFISMLSTSKYEYRTAHDQLQVLATHGNKYYVMSENNVINDITDIINRAANGTEEEFIEEVKMDVYNYYHPEDPNMIGTTPEVGSIVVKKITSDIAKKKENPTFSPDPVEVVTLAGFKSDERGDQGNDYAEISLREDYVTKSAILLDGGMLFPTMSDKKTWVYLKGIELPGINHSHGYASQTLNKLDGNGWFSQLDSVTEQFLEYAQTEYMSVQLAIKQAESLPEDQKVKNFHKANVKLKRGKETIKIPIIQGGRFTSLLGVYDYVIENGKTVRKFIEFNRVLDENGKVLNERDNLKIAEKHFFLPLPKRDETGNILLDANAQPIMETADEVKERQKRQIAEVLQHQLVEELKYVELIGLIKRRPTTEKSSLTQYQNVGLDQTKIKAIAVALAQQYGLSWNNTTKEVHEKLEALAVAVLVNDTMVKHIMSLQEIERLYSGNPAFFKFGYDNDGHLVDRSIDQAKRFGGLVSTGQPNDLEQDVPTTYRAAEVDNEMVEASNIESLHKLMVEGQIRSTYLRQLLDEHHISIEDEEGAKKYAEIADTTPLDEVMKKLDPTALKIAKKIAEKKTNSFRMGEHEGKNYDGIDVADGGAYVTDEMAENMLKMVGSYDEEVQKAFEILRDPKQVHSIREKADAYNKVWTTVIGTQKYTAYGFRHQNGVQVPYYNKMALFPLFKCICTGNMAKIYEKMKADKVDMLMVNSAVKVGSQGSKPITDWNSFESDFHFSPYTQKFSYLRKQFNTDPKEEEEMNVGTQMKKIAMSAIIPGREYTTLDGRTMSAKAIRDEIMGSIKSMSKLGLQAIEKEFFDEDGQLDVEKFSNFLTKELSSRGASREMLDAVSIIDENSVGISDEQRERIKRTGKKELKVPLVALSNMNWVQSIIVSRINSKVVDTPTPGAAFVQRSVWAMEGATSVIDDTNLPEDINGGQDLKMVNEEGSMDCVLSIDFFDHLLPKKIVGYKMKDGEFVLNKKGDRIPIYLKLSFNEAKQYLIDNGIIGPNAHANMVGYRIPTQAISSIHALRCVDVIPVVRDTVILPKEFTKITGSDKHINVRTLKNSFNCWEALTLRRGLSAAKTILLYVSIVRFND